MNQLDKDKSRDKIESLIGKGMDLPKCLKCACMKSGLEALSNSISGEEKDQNKLRNKVEAWQSRMKEIEYSCLGCKTCFPADAINVLNREFPETANISLSCSFEGERKSWPSIPGEYHVISNNPDCTVAVSTLASVALADAIYEIKPDGLCIVGKTETENIGIDKIVKNIISNPSIGHLIVAGIDSEGHRPGMTLLALGENGVDQKMRVIGSPGRRPVLKNVSKGDVEAFRKQVQVTNMIGSLDISLITKKIAELRGQDIVKSSCGCHGCDEKTESVSASTTEIIEARPPAHIKLDKAGYFVIIPQPETGKIVVEHYSYDNRFQRTVEGSEARSIYWTIIQNGWVTELSHAAYLGKELARAELSLQTGSKYIQDGA